MTEAHTALVLAHDGLVRAIATSYVRRLKPGRLDADDVFQAGRLGLCDAARKWSPARGVPFGGYARLRIRGAILDALEHGPVITPRRDWNAVAVSQWRPQCDVPAPSVSLDRAVDVRRAVAEAWSLRDARERRVVVHYAAGVPMRATAALVGLTVSRVGQIRVDGVKHLRRQMGVRAHEHPRVGPDA